MVPGQWNASKSLQVSIYYNNGADASNYILQTYDIFLLSFTIYIQQYIHESQNIYFSTSI